MERDDKLLGVSIYSPFWPRLIGGCYALAALLLAVSGALLIVSSR